MFPHKAIEIRERDTVSGEMGPWRCYKYTVDENELMNSYVYYGPYLDRQLYKSLSPYYMQ